MQAKSPVRILDELNVMEVVPTPYFPSIIERRQANLSQEDAHATLNMSETDMSNTCVSSDANNDRLRCSEGGMDVKFGMRRRHRCFVVTARARSFLYHQVGVSVLPKTSSSSNQTEKCF